MTYLSPATPASRGSCAEIIEAHAKASILTIEASKKFRLIFSPVSGRAIFTRILTLFQ
jgi:hypothetical protein